MNIIHTRKPEGWSGFFELLFRGVSGGGLHCYEVEDYQHPEDAVKLCQWLLDNQDDRCEVSISNRKMCFRTESSKLNWIHGFLIGSDWTLKSWERFRESRVK